MIVLILKKNVVLIFLVKLYFYWLQVISSQSVYSLIFYYTKKHINNIKIYFYIYKKYDSTPQYSMSNYYLKSNIANILDYMNE